MVKGE